MKEIPEERIRRSTQNGTDLKVEDPAVGVSLENGYGDSAISGDSITATQIYSNDYEKTLPSHYRLIRMIARGGMAEVFLAHDERLGRNVAIKFLSSEFRKDPDRMRRFNREARAASALNHPNILVVHDIGETEGVQFIVSEYVDGETLGSRISRGPVSIAEAAEIAIQIASALAAAHKAGVVHRDIKPDNVIIRNDGVVKVVDFGLAKDFSERISSPEAKTVATVSTPGLVLGTPQYMSPEQARGQFLDARTDIFSLGVIIFEMVTGTRPFKGGSIADVIASLLHKEPEDVENYIVDPPFLLCQILRDCLKKDRDFRYGSMDRLLADLRTLKDEVGSVEYRARTTGISEATPTFEHTIRTVAAKIARWDIGLLVAGALVIGGLAWWFWSTRRADTAFTGSMRTIPITSWSSGAGDLLSSASFSPDGKMVAYSATKLDATEIWVKPSTGGDPVQVTRNGYYNLYPIWSPNGDEIAFMSNRNGDRAIWRASFTGGEQKKLMNVGANARPMYWSKEGKLYFQEGPELFAIGVDSADRQQITDFRSKNLTPWEMEIAPDEKTLAYSIKTNDGWKLMAQRLGDEAAREIASTQQQVDNIAWNADSKTIVYSASVDGAYQAFRADVNGGQPVQISNGNADFLVQDISNDRSKILYSSVNETGDLWSVDTDTLKETVVASEVASEYWPEVSPDGQNIAYQIVPQVDRVFGGSIRVLSRADLKPVTNVSPQGFLPVWSPDSRWIALLRRDGASIGIYRFDPASGEIIKLAEGPVTAPSYILTPHLKIGADSISWSPAGDSVAYAMTSDGVSNIWLAAADGSGSKAVTNNQDSNEKLSCPVWSPDGKYLMVASSGTPMRKVSRLSLYSVADGTSGWFVESASTLRFLGFNEDGTQAVVASAAGPTSSAALPQSVIILSHPVNGRGGRQIITLENTYLQNIQLSPNRRTIAFVSRRDDQTALWTVPVIGGTPKRILTENDPKILISSLAWAPDGRSIIFGKETRTNLLSMLAK
jgi:serine/threonine protein kinase